MLLRNNNKKFIRVLSDNCLNANKIRNRIALLAILLTAVLFSALTTVFQGTSLTIKEQMMRQSGTDYMVSIKYIPDQKAEEIRNNPAFKKTGLQKSVGYAVNQELNNIAAFICQEEAEYSLHTYKELIKGNYPQKENEIACDTEVLHLLNLPEKIGQKFLLKYEVDGTAKQQEMTVCGFWKGGKYEQSAELLVSKSFIEKEIRAAADNKNSTVGLNILRGSFFEDKDVSGQLDQVLADAGYDPNSEREEAGYVVHHISTAYEMGSDMSVQTILGITAGVFIILLAGYLIIYNIFRISVMKDIRLYGQLKTIGASHRQIRYMVKRQGMRLALRGIPAGIIAGWLLGNLLLPIIMKSSNFSETTFLLPNIWAWLFSALFTLLTVWISCSRPGKMAGKIAPIDAMRYQEKEENGKKRRRGKDSANRIIQMAAANLGRNKGKTVLVVLSLSISIILLNSVYNYVRCFDMETYLKRDHVTDFTVSAVNFGKPMKIDSEKYVTKDVIHQLESDERIKDLGKIYYKGSESQEQVGSYDMLAKVRSVNGSSLTGVEKESAGLHQIYGLTEEVMNRGKLIEGQLDMQKLNSGRYVIALGFLGDRGDYMKEAQSLHAGDVIQVEVDGSSYEYEISAVLGMPSSLLMDYSSGAYEGITFSEQAFLKQFPKFTDPLHCIFNAEEGTFQSLNTDLTDMAEQGGGSVSTKLSSQAEFKEYMAVYQNVGTILAILFGLIGILNLLNVQLTGAIARRNEFAAMRSIGMTNRQLRKLFVLEGVFYALLSAAAGIVLSAICSVTIVKSLSAGTWFAKYQFMAAPACAVAALGILLSAGIAYFIDRLWNHGSIVENLRQIE